MWCHLMMEEPHARRRRLFSKVLLLLLSTAVYWAWRHLPVVTALWLMSVAAYAAVMRWRTDPMPLVLLPAFLTVAGAAYVLIGGIVAEFGGKMTGTNSAHNFTAIPWRT